jgi:anti-sigma factor RsiW
MSAFGPDHLGPDAVVAFVDDELARRPHERAVAHVDSCPECAAEVVAQRRARSALRGADCPSLPSSLLSALRSIPQSTELPPAPAGLAVGPDGEVVSVLRTPPAPAPAPPEPAPAAHGRRPSRRTRFGAGVAVSGFALGALALGVTNTPLDPAPTGVGPLGGPLPAPAAGAAFGVDARTDAADPRLPADATRPRTFLRGAER